MNYSKTDPQNDKKRLLIVKEIESMILTMVLIALENINVNLKEEYIAVQESKDDFMPF